MYACIRLHIVAWLLFFTIIYISQLAHTAMMDVQGQNRDMEVSTMPTGLYPPLGKHAFISYS